MLQKQVNLYHIPFEELLKKVKAFFPSSSYDFKKHVLFLENEHFKTLGSIRLPLHLQLDNSFNFLSNEAVVLYLTIESGNAAIHVMEGTQNVYHTTFSAYMTRKKQGFSQVKYLNKKGKSRAGSRVRLASTLEFFENINTTLTTLMEEYAVDRIAISCGATLWPFLFQSKVACPFEKQDERLYKIPLHLPQSNHTNLEVAIKKLKAPVLFYEEGTEKVLSALIKF